MFSLIPGGLSSCTSGYHPLFFVHHLVRVVITLHSLCMSILLFPGITPHNLFPFRYTKLFNY